MAGIFSRYIFNNAIFNTDDAVVASGGKPNPYANEYTRGRIAWEIEQRAKIEAERLARQERQTLEAEEEEKARLLSQREAEIARLEEERRQDLYDQAMQQRLLELLTESYVLQKTLESVRQRLAFLRQQDEEALIILLSTPFV